MKRLPPKQLTKIAEQYGADISGLADELKAKLDKVSAPESLEANELRAVLATRVEPAADMAPAPEEQVAEERIIATTAGARPVARIRDNKATIEFIGPDSQSWAKVITDAKPVIDAAIPAVGRIELNNSDYPWAGTGWLIAPGIIVTNRHVAEVFAKIDRNAPHPLFKPGLSGGSVSADIDFLEEENRLDSAEHPITSILWMAPSNEADVAFLQVSKAAGLSLPQPIELIDDVEQGQTVVAIGYPARDPSIRDQQLVISIFGPDVYDKKRLSPGKVMSVDGNRIKHDCSTLGGNSGSVLLELRTGRAIGIHRAGLVDDTANLGVTAAYLRQLLSKTSRSTISVPKRPAPLPDRSETKVLPQQQLTGTFRLKLHVPIEIIVNVGTPVFPPGLQPAAPDAGAGPDQPTAGGFEAALEDAKKRLSGYPGVLKIRPGYRFKNGWITDERVVVIELKEKLAFGDLQKTGTAPSPVKFSASASTCERPLSQISSKHSASTLPPWSDRASQLRTPNPPATTTNSRVCSWAP